MKFLLAFAILLLSFSSSCTSLARSDRESPEVTVSGISSGAFMAVQLQVALSSKIKGVGTVAGGPYWCAQGGRHSLLCMFTPARVRVESLQDFAKEEAAEGKIDPLENLAKAKIYIYQSKADQTVKVEAADKLEEFFRLYTEPSRIKKEIAETGSHAFPTDSFGEDCEKVGIPYVVNCGRDVAGEILSHLYGKLKAKSLAHPNNLIEFDQKPLLVDGSGMAEKGHAYVPRACERGGCRVHVALHGCQMGPEFIADEFRAHAGYNDWAESNRIVVVYPAVLKGPKNPHGCWDWFGYTDSNYANRMGKQIQSLEKIIEYWVK